MSEQTPAGAKKPATRKPAARKKATGPTKAAALKKLGLTQEDLDTLKAITEARAAVAEARAEQAAPSGTLEVEAVVERAEPANDEVNQEDQTEEAPTGPWFVRNLRNVEFRMRLDRQKSGTKSTTLKPRGSRGDLVKLQPEDLEDDNLIANVELGIIEIIPLGEAKAVLAKQATNQQQAVHPAMAMLRNELGKPYDPSAIRTEAEFNSQGVVVAHLQPQGGEAGALPSSGRGIDWQAARQGVQTPVQGNQHIISDGFAPQGDPSATADAIARRKDIEGPAAGLGGLQFGGVDPVQKS